MRDCNRSRQTERRKKPLDADENEQLGKAFCFRYRSDQESSVRVPVSLGENGKGRHIADAWKEAQVIRERINVSQVVPVQRQRPAYVSVACIPA